MRSVRWLVQSHDLLRQSHDFLDGHQGIYSVNVSFVVYAHVISQKIDSVQCICMFFKNV